MSNDLFVSVVVAAYNEEKYLKLCIASLVKQSYDTAHYEIILVDDGSTDATEQICRDAITGYAKTPPKITYLRLSHAGLSHARNCGIHVAQGDIIAFIDGDAIADEAWAQEMVKAFCQHEELDVIGGKVVLYNEDSHFAQLSQAQWDVSSQENPENMLLMGTNMAFRKRFFDDDHGFFHVFDRRGDETMVLYAQRLKHHYEKGKSPCGRLMLMPNMEVRHEQPDTFSGWISTRKDNGRFSAAIGKILKQHYPDAFCDVGKGFSPWRIALRPFLNFLYMPSYMVRFSRFLSVSDAWAATCMYSLGSVYCNLFFLFYTVYYQLFPPHSMRSVKASATYICEIAENGVQALS